MPKALRAQIEQLREDNNDLRASALLWRRLYEYGINGVNVRSQLVPADPPHDSATITSSVHMASTVCAIPQRRQFLIDRAV